MEDIENWTFDNIEEGWWREYVLRIGDWTFFDLVYFLAVDKESRSRAQRKANMQTLREWTRKYFYTDKQFISDPGMLRIMIVLGFLDM